MMPDDPRLLSEWTERQRSTETLIRIEERTRTISDELKEVKAILVTKTEFQPVRMIVYGLVALIVTAVITALVAQVVVQTTG